MKLWLTPKFCSQWLWMHAFPLLQHPFSWKSIHPHSYSRSESEFTLFLVQNNGESIVDAEPMQLFSTSSQLSSSNYLRFLSSLIGVMQRLFTNSFRDNIIFIIDYKNSMVYRYKYLGNLISYSHQDILRKWRQSNEFFVKKISKCLEISFMSDIFDSFIFYFFFTQSNNR